MSHNKINYVLFLVVNSLNFKKRGIFLFFVFLLIIAVPACSQNIPKQPNFLTKYGGDPYMGTVKVTIVKPDGITAKTDYGEANAHFTEKAKGQAQMVLFGAIRDKKGDAGFVIDGPYKGATWKSDSKGVVLEVDSNGRFSGGGELRTQKFAFAGTMSGGYIDFVLRITELEKTAGGYPAGTTFVFIYSLSRSKQDIVTADNKSGSTTSKKKCKKIVWKTRYIGHFDGSGSTVRVPVCMD
jgi:hypothetical protein